MWATFIGFFLLATAVTGCQSRKEYQLFCDPNTPRLQCTAAVSDHKCQQAAALVQRCAWFVRNQVNRDAPGSAMRDLPPQYQNLTFQPRAIGMLQSGTVIYLDASTTAGFLNTVTFAEKLVEERVKRYRIESTSYSRTVSSGLQTSDTKVRQAIAEIEKLQPVLQEAHAIGRDVQSVLDTPASFDFRAHALRVVNETAPSDIYLRQAAELAIRTNAWGREQPGELVREANRKLEDLQQTVATPFTQQFDYLKQRAEVAGKKAAQRRARSLRYSGSVGGGKSYGGACSCAGGNVCYGPRGGRYCITSGGNKRYGI
ncbi:hypothetical protein A7D27_25850 [Pseudomonas sp. 1D4]|uniref:hypothetical protein n=1 Tax=Pseudomonadaceae TaxID=135621 RepID=UPI00084ACD4C|nr:MULTISPECIES: hypothetical protein [Pseudomonas]OEC37037.1 hypothetical protein A7D27_25850 [Pseudomonas sp. 1D4]